MSPLRRNEPDARGMRLETYAPDGGAGTPTAGVRVERGMNGIGLLALMFIAVPILELILLIQIGQVLGVLPTVALVLLTGVAGAALARMEGLRVLRQFQQELAAGRMPGQAMLDGASVLLGGALLLTPGV